MIRYDTIRYDISVETTVQPIPIFDQCKLLEWLVVQWQTVMTTVFIATFGTPTW